jgi:hypothetical protein
VRKKKLLSQSRQAAKGLSNFFAPAYRRQVFPALREKKEVSAQSLPTAGRTRRRKGFFSLRLCAFARKKKTNNSHKSAKGFSNFFAPAYRRQDVKDLILLLLWKKKKLARKACLPQAGRQAAKGFSLHAKK